MNTAKCLRCRTSTAVASKAEGDQWFRLHKRTCTARRVSPTTSVTPSRAAVVGRTRPVDPVLASRLKYVRELKPIPVSAASSTHASNRWERVDHDAWGRRVAGGVRWTGGNCLRAAVGFLLHAGDISSIPGNDDLESDHDWLEKYNARLDRIGYRLEQLSTDVALASRRNRWIAVLNEDPGQTHAVVAQGNVVSFDPAERYAGPVPHRRLAYGLMLVSTARLRLSMWSPSKGRMVAVA